MSSVLPVTTRYTTSRFSRVLQQPRTGLSGFMFPTVCEGLLQESERLSLLLYFEAGKEMRSMVKDKRNVHYTK